ncbi:pyridoxamine 5'-phosphate oxidase family protein [Parvibaculum sedimenti]|uniref:Pyridoxamine 5'-phosphate oxidase family protein n=1 Tax=Parvibaculum sedimenti TaxID=2608632 RepID=A0A6N6VMY0_9HYPH|nr:pyridoxamine 5'-phosphate oxidase family protein [Parvibaculum sedimenti]KAB7740104.1 pyridoxamine 5'-phosphate oxidase family protein [Parvibaculum sedimenti]
MAKQFASIEPNLRAFIERQHIFFVASATAESRVNLSPKGLDALRVLGPNSAVYLDHTGSGSETAAHLKADGRLTIMFCAFEGAPMILRLYGRGRVVRRGSEEYARLLAAEFGGVEPAGARQMVMLDIGMVQTSCGYAVPHFEYQEERPGLTRWAEGKGEEGLDAYRREKNMVSIDGLPTGLFDDTE